MKIKVMAEAAFEAANEEEAERIRVQAVEAFEAFTRANGGNEYNSTWVRTRTRRTKAEIDAARNAG